MPQLDFNNILVISQVVWLALIFAVLYWLVSRWALPQVAAVIEDRAARIATDLNSAHAAKTGADSAVLELQAATRKASADSQAAIGSAIAQAKQEAAEQTRLANAKLDQQLGEAEKRIASARTTAMGALREVATDTAAVVVARLTGQQADHDAISGAVGTALAARG